VKRLAVPAILRITTALMAVLLAALMSSSASGLGRAKAGALLASSSGPASMPVAWAQERSPTTAGAIAVTFRRTPCASGPQWLDLSLSDKGFAPGTSVGLGPLSADQGTFCLGRVASGGDSLHALQVDATFNWTPSVPQGSVQWLDLSLLSNGSAPGTFVSAGPLPPSVTSFKWPGLLPGFIHYWRVNSLTPCGWYPSPTASFRSDYCGTLPLAHEKETAV
jgi:hypothetical protein